MGPIRSTRTRYASQWSARRGKGTTSRQLLASAVLGARKRPHRWTSRSGARSARLGARYGRKRSQVGRPYASPRSRRRRVYGHSMRIRGDPWSAPFLSLRPRCLRFRRRSTVVSDVRGQASAWPLGTLQRQEKRTFGAQSCFTTCGAMVDFTGARRLSF